MYKNKIKENSRLARVLYPGGRAVIGTGELWTAAISVLIALFSIGTVIYYICGPMEGYLHSDYTDTIYWANATLESGQIFDPNFAYAGLLPFSANLWFMPLIAIFGVGMTAQRIGMIIYLLLLVAAIYYMCRGFKWSLSATALTVAATVALLSGSDKLREIMWGHVIYYSLAILLLCLTVGLVTRIAERRNGKGGYSPLLCIFAAVTFVGVGTDGFQMIALITLPCVVALLYDPLTSPNKKLLDKGNSERYLISAAILLATLVGFLLLSVMKGDIEVKYAAGYSSLSVPGTWGENIVKLPAHWFSLLGLDHGSTVELLSLGGLKSLIFIALGLALIVIPTVALFNFKKIEDKSARVLLTVHLTVTAVVLFGYVFGTLGDVNWRMTPMLGTAILSSAAILRYYFSKRVEGGYLPVRLAATAAAVMFAASAVNVVSMVNMPYDYGRSNDHHMLVEELERLELERGYATFWNSQALTVLSDSKVKTMMILVNEREGVTTDYYQNSTVWYEDSEDTDDYFVLFTLDEHYKVEESVKWEELVNERSPEKLYLLDKYVLYIFDTNLDFGS